VADEIPWIEPADVAAEIERRSGHERGRLTAAQLVFPNAFDRELRQIHLSVFRWDGDPANPTPQQQAASAYVEAAKRARADMGEDPGFCVNTMRLLIRRLATGDEAIDIAMTHAHLRTKYEAEVRRVVLGRFDALRDPGDVVVCLADACANVKGA
jgi:hypothetical protein